MHDAKTMPQKVASGKYGEDVPALDRSAKTREERGSQNKRKSYGPPAGTKPVQGKLEAVGGGSADAPSFPLH
jgi:hypothetical protein